MGAVTTNKFPTLIPPVLCVAPIAMLVLMQGGFFALPTCIVGVLCCVGGIVAWLRAPDRTQAVPAFALLFMGLAVAYLVSAIASGVTLTTLSEVGVWAACAGYALVCCALSNRTRNNALTFLAWFGVATSVAGIAMQGQRLQFTFQYANAAAAWFGVMVFLCLLSPHPRMRAFAALPATAMLNTQSGGAILVFAAIALVVAIRWAQGGLWNKLMFALVQTFVSLLLFVIAYLVGGVVAMLAAATAIALGCLSNTWWEQLAQRANMRRAVLVLAFLVMAGVVFAAFLLQGRIAAALVSMQERWYQIWDGLHLWSTSPIVGVGPDNWQFLYAYVQRAPYTTTVVHSSLVQFAVDSGVLGLGFFVVASVLGVWEIRRSMRGSAQDPDTEPWAAARLCAACLLLAHSLVEFDMQFSSLAFLLVLLLSNTRVKVPHTKGALASVASLVLLLPMCVLGLLCALSLSVIEASSAQGDYAVCAHMYEANPLARADVAAQQEYAACLFNQGQYQQVLDAHAHMPAPTDRSVYYAVLSYEAQGKREEATQLLIDRLKAQPYNVDFCTSAKQVASVYGIPPALNAQFGAVVGEVDRRVGEFEWVR